MKDYGIVRGSEESAKEIIIGKDTVYIHSDIKRIVDEYDCEYYEYHEIQYSKDEYISLLAQSNKSIEKTVNEITYNVDETTLSVDELKEYKISVSKKLLSDWLSNHPYLYSDGNYYSVTEEKQSLLNSNLASYERAKSMGIIYDLKWNATEQPCESWSYTDLLTLSLNIAAYVAPKVSKQQLLEAQIRNCETMEDIEAVVIDYNE